MASSYRNKFSYRKVGKMAALHKCSLQRSVFPVEIAPENSASLFFFTCRHPVPRCLIWDQFCVHGLGFTAGNAKYNRCSWIILAGVLNANDIRCETAPLNLFECYIRRFNSITVNLIELFCLTINN